MSIATVIITKNEAENIASCLESVSSFSDEIIVVDSFSTDRTETIARSFPKVRFFQREFDNYVAQKNYANALVKSNYILSLDADEYLDTSMLVFMESEAYINHTAISFQRINYIGTQAIRHGLWSRDIKLRVWKRERALWTGSLPHEHLELKLGTQVYKSNASLRHRAYKDLDTLSHKSRHYATLAAESYRSQWSIVLIVSIMINPIFKFFKGYVLLQGFRDGSYGWAIAKVSALETFYKYFYALKWKWR